MLIAGIQFGDDFLSFDTLDTNGDGILDIRDCPFPHGSAKAKWWWSNVVEPITKAQVTDDMREDYGDRVVGAYQGKPLVPGEAGRGQGDFQFLVDKLQVTRGLSPLAATKVAAKIKNNLYGG